MHRLNIKKIKLSLVIMIAIFLLSFNAQAGYRDMEIVEHNTISAASLDVALLDIESEPSDHIMPGDVISKSVTIENAGSLDVKYGVSFVKKSEKNSLCSKRSRLL